MRAFIVGSLFLTAIAQGSATAVDPSMAQWLQALSSGSAVTTLAAVVVAFYTNRLVSGKLYQESRDECEELRSTLAERSKAMEDRVIPALVEATNAVKDSRDRAQG